LVQKFNAKLGGVNQLVTLMRALTSPSARSDTFMFFGLFIELVLMMVHFKKYLIMNYELFNEHVKVIISKIILQKDYFDYFRIIWS
jgi:hypothetical protein